jgi:hypothetical protein
MVPQAHLPGAEAEVDFGEFHAVIAGVLLKLWMFVMRLSCPGRAFHVAFATQAQEAFLEGHVLALEYFGAVPGRVRYDNLKPAVVRVLRGRDRAESERFIALRSHYGFDSFFCTPGKEGAYEKGGVEGEIGRFAAATWCPSPPPGRRPGSRPSQRRRPLPYQVVLSGQAKLCVGRSSRVRMPREYSRLAVSLGWFWHTCGRDDCQPWQLSGMVPPLVLRMAVIMPPSHPLVLAREPAIVNIPNAAWVLVMLHAPVRPSSGVGPGLAAATPAVASVSGRAEASRSPLAQRSRLTFIVRSPLVRSP